MDRSKVQYRRLLKVMELIREKRRPTGEDNLPELSVGGLEKLHNCESIAMELEVNARTIQRDINFLRDELGAPIEYDEKRHGYYFTKPEFTIPGGMITRDDVCGLVVAEMLLRQLGLTAIAGKLSGFVNRAMAESACDAAVDIRVAVEQICCVRDATVAQVPEKILATILSAVQKRRLIMVYLRPEVRNGCNPGLRMEIRKFVVGLEGHTLAGIVYPRDGVPYQRDVLLSDLESVIVLPSGPPPVEHGPAGADIRAETMRPPETDESVSQAA
jgi:hypothetical protein